MHAAVIKLDTLTDTVRATAQHHDFLTVGWVGFTLFFIRRVHISSARGEFARTGVHTLIDRTHTIHAAQLTHVAIFDFK